MWIGIFFLVVIFVMLAVWGITMSVLYVNKTGMYSSYSVVELNDNDNGDLTIPKILRAPESMNFSPPRIDLKPSIPLLVFQTWKSDKVSREFWTNYRLNANINYELTREFFNDDDCRNYIAKEYGPDSNTLKAYDSLTVGAYKSDIWRLCILYKRGGFYKDANKPILVNLKTFADSGFDLVVFRDIPEGMVFQGLIGAAPGNEHIKYILDHIVQDVLARKVLTTPLSPTGPESFGLYFRESTGIGIPIPVGVVNDTIYIGQVLNHQLCDESGNVIQVGRYAGSTRVEKMADHYSTIWPNIYK